MSEITEDQAAELIASMRSDGDRFRERARAVATLAASAAGAVTAGLVFSNEGQNWPALVRVSGILGIVLLAVSVCFFLSASLYYVRDKKNPDAPKAPAAKISPTQSLLNARSKSENVAKVISKRSDRGKYLGIAGLCLLFLMLPLGAFLPEERSKVNVQIVANNHPGILQCPKITNSFTGEVRTSQLAGTSTLLPIIVQNEACGDKDNQQAKTIFVLRSQILIVTASTT